MGIQVGEEFISVLILINMQHLLGEMKNPLFFSLPDFGLKLFLLIAIYFLTLPSKPATDWLVVLVIRHCSKILPGPALLQPLEITGILPNVMFVDLQASTTLHSFSFGLYISKQCVDENSQTPFFPLKWIVYMFAKLPSALLCNRSLGRVFVLNLLSWISKWFPSEF